MAVTETRLPSLRISASSTADNYDGKFMFNDPQTIDMNDTQVALSVLNAASATQVTSNVLYVDPNSAGGTEDLLLPTEASSKGLELIIVNTAGGAEDIVVKDDSDTTTVATIGQNEFGIFVCDGTTWRGGTISSTTEQGFLSGVTAGTASASKAVVLGTSKDIAGLGATTFVVGGGTAILSTNTAADTTTARHKFQSTSPGDGTEVGDLLGAYGLATVAATDTVADAKTVAGGLFWCEVFSTGNVCDGGGGSVLAASRHIMQVKQNLSPLSGRASAIIYAEAWNDAVGGDIDAGIYILNNQETGAGNFGAGVFIGSGAGSGGSATFTYGIDMSSAAIGTAHIKLGSVSGEDLVIAVGNFADAADSGFAPGSIGLDSTDGLLFICDSAGLWQQVGLA